MIKVCDTCFLESPKLTEYLARSSSNNIAISEPTRIECTTGDPVINFFNSLTLVSYYPDQLVMLKGMRKIYGLKLGDSGLRRRMTDAAQTQAVSSRLKQWRRGRLPTPTEFEHIQSLGRGSEMEIQKALAGQEEIKKGMQGLKSIFGKGLLRKVMNCEMLKDEEKQKISAHGALLFGNLLKKGRLITPITIPKSSGELKNHFLARHAICSIAHTFYWMQNDLQRAKIETLRNYGTDCLIITHSTYFDGLLTEDKNMRKIQKITLHLLGQLEFPIVEQQ